MHRWCVISLLAALLTSVVMQAQDNRNLAYNGDFRKAFEPVKCPFLVVSFSSDWLFPEYQSRTLTEILLENGNDVTFCNIQSGYGHDAFLLEYETLGKLMSGFLTNIEPEVKP